jgi:hypothetical protein
VVHWLHYTENKAHGLISNYLKKIETWQHHKTSDIVDFFPTSNGFNFWHLTVDDVKKNMSFLELSCDANSANFQLNLAVS